MQRRSSAYYDDTNGVPLEDGRTHHVGVAQGEVANRIVLVGSSSRAATLCSLLDGALREDHLVYGQIARGQPYEQARPGDQGPYLLVSYIPLANECRHLAVLKPT